MTGGKPPRGRPPSREPIRPKGFDDVPELSAEEVERRVDVRGGGAPRGPVERPSRERRVPPPQERTVARDSLLLIGLVVVGLVAVRFLLPPGPLTASSTSQPSGTAAAAASVAPSIGPVNTPSVQTLEPGPTATLGSETAPPTLAPTEAPIPTPTPKPGQTPKPTPRPTRTPTPTAGPTSPPTTASLLVKVVSLTDGGGTATASSWTVSVSTAGTATPSSFTGSTSGTTVTLSAGATYSVSSSGPSGYTQTFTADCSSATGGVPVSGASETCTITRDDIKPKVTVYTIVDNGAGGTQTPADWAVTVSGTVVSPSGSFAGTSSGREFRFNANQPFSVGQSNPNDAGYQQAVDGTCSSSSEDPGAVLTCTYTFTYVPPTAPVLPIGWTVPLITVSGLRGRRAWLTRPGR